jgi:Mg/Co/Ni transporter MgtE
MAAVEYSRLESLLKGSAYPELEQIMAGVDLAELASIWPQFGAMSKLVLFKLIDAQRALEFYEMLPLKEKYYLLCGFPLQSIAPVLEKLSPIQRRLFVSLPKEFYNRMFQQLVSERVEINFPLSKN